MRTFDRRAQLIAYPDSLGGTIAAITELLSTDLAGWFPGGVHLLPPFPSTGDRGFAPTCYDRVEPRFGSWSDLVELAATAPLTLDVMVNHISRQSEEFRDFASSGRLSPVADLFLWTDKVWPGGQVSPDDLRAIFLRKPDDPFLEVVIDETGATERIWATFGTARDQSEQIDLDWRSPLTREKYDQWFSGLAAAGATEVRLDAVGYVAKRAGTSCFMIEPEIWEVLDLLAAVAGHHGLQVLPEVHATPGVVAGLDHHGYPRYDFVLPGLVLAAMRRGHAGALAEHLTSLPGTAVTQLDCHDGVPIQPDLVGVVPTEELRELTEALEGRGANLNRILGAADRGIDFDAHQVNISYLDAAGGEDGLAVARAIQLFAPGRPQVYYQGLLGGGNDPVAVTVTGEGRAINRSDYSLAEVRESLRAPVVRRQQRLLDIRNHHPAFAAARPLVSSPADTSLAVRWEHDDHWCELAVDLAACTGVVTMSAVDGLTAGPV